MVYRCCQALAVPGLTPRAIIWITPTGFGIVAGGGGVNVCAYTVFLT